MIRNISANQLARANELTPLFFSIQNFCLQDGPGIRSVVFFKGCPLRCKWCHNPESWSLKPQLAFKKHLCLDCGKCIESCPEGAISSPGKWDSGKCNLCFECVESCPSEALTHFGFSRTVESIIDELKPEYTYFQNSGGGVTFSGGESTLFPEYASQLAKALQSDKVHLTLETCGHFELKGIDLILKSTNARAHQPHGKVWNFLSRLNLILYDIKIFDNEKHRKNCGVGNDIIKKNLRGLAALMNSGSGPVVWPRLPLIPSITDDKDNLTGWAHFLREAGITNVTLIPYHNLGESKKTWIGVEMKTDIPDFSESCLKSAKEILTKEGISCHSPGEEEWERFSLKK